MDKSTLSSNTPSASSSVSQRAAREHTQRAGIYRRVFPVAISLGALTWLFDALLDYLIFFPGSNFLKILLIGPPEHEFYIRILILIIFLLFGFYVARLLVRERYTSLQLQQSLDDQELLLREIHHRVKNNLSLVSSLISLKESALDEEVDLSDLRNQINAIEKVHKALQHSDDIVHINLKRHVADILSSVFQSSTGQHVAIENNIADISVRTEAALPLGLIINETATNALQHGFTGENDARFTVAMEEDSEGENYVLTISNTGGPFPDDVDIENPQGLGLQLVSALVAQLQGTLELQRKPQPVFTIRFPVRET